MTPNLRFNKYITKKLLSSKSAQPLTPHSVVWNVKNHPENTYGTYLDTLFNTWMFIIQPYDVGHRLVILHNKGVYGLYLIDDLEKYAKALPVGMLNQGIDEVLAKAFGELKQHPNTGIWEIDENEEKIYLYDHKNY